MNKSVRISVYLTLLSVAGMLGSVGCRQAGGCHNGSCPAPSGGFSSPGYGGSSYQGSTTVSPGYSAPSQSYTAPGGSGTRSAPVMGGSGTR